VKSDHIVENLDVALRERLYPAITQWNRLEGRPRTHDFERALRAEVRDALWMISRQWQMGEFQGEDTGSPVLARAWIDTWKVDRFQAANGQVKDFTIDEPLEATVEKRSVPKGPLFSLDIRLLVGRRWLKMLAADLTLTGLQEFYKTHYPIPVPDPTSPADALVCAHAEAFQQISAVAGKAMDGLSFIQHLENGEAAGEGTGGSQTQMDALAALAVELQQWITTLIRQPAKGETDAWLPSRFEYQFGCSASKDDTEIVMRAEEYYQGNLDWYALEHKSAQANLGDAGSAAAAHRVLNTFIPSGIRFEGMPETRWWAFEDRRTNFGNIKPDATDLGKLFLMEFGLLYANDWFVLPYTLPLNTVAQAQGIAITNVFGETFWIEPARDLPGGEKWRFCTLTSDAPDGEFGHGAVVLLPTPEKIQEGTPLEEVALVRDEMANMVWAIEKRVPLPSGRSKPGAEAGRDLRAYLSKFVPAPAGPLPDPVAPIRYEAMNSVPEHWIPFVPVHMPGNTREIQLQRAGMPRIFPGDTRPLQKVHPRTSLLLTNYPKAFFVFEEEVPRAGTVVTQSYQRSRWLGGSVFTWFGARKQTGRGEGSSGLRFDAIVPTGRKQTP
jgi:hypothetical protein